MSEDEFEALAAVAGWIVDICPMDDYYSGVIVRKEGGKWYAETGHTTQDVIDKLREKVFP